MTVEKKPVAMVHFLDDNGKPTGHDFPYLIPKHLEEKCEGGVMVCVPLKETYVPAIIVDLTWTSYLSANKIKTLESIAFIGGSTNMKTKEPSELICVDALPTIEARLEAENALIAEKIANYLSIVPTKEGIQSIKSGRAELNNMFKEFEGQRIRLNKALDKQYDDFLVPYKKNISAPLIDAESRLKKIVDEYEDAIKGVKEAEIREYFADYLLNYSNIDFLTFERVGLNVTKTANTEALKKQCADFIDKVADELEMFKTLDNQAEILVEYIPTLNASQAILTITAKHKAIEMQKAAIEAQKQAYKPIPIPESVLTLDDSSKIEPEPEIEEVLQKVAWVLFKDDNGEFTGRDYSYLLPENVGYYAGEILEVDTKRGKTTAQIIKFGTIKDVPDHVIPFLKYLPEPKEIDGFAVPDFEPSDFEFEPFAPTVEKPNERAEATIRIAIVDSIERIDALLEMLNQLGYSYREIREA